MLLTPLSFVGLIALLRHAQVYGVLMNVWAGLKYTLRRNGLCRTGGVQASPANLSLPCSLDMAALNRC